MLNKFCHQLRAMQIYAHAAHHLVARAPFHSDHEFFGEVYPEYEADFDGVSERIIGLHGEEYMNLNEQLAAVSSKLQGLPTTGVKENATFYQALLQLEQELCSMGNQICKHPEASEGLKQLVGGICDKSEVRQYKMKQRIKK